MREAENIREVEQLKVDMIGFIFYPKSPRCLYELPAYMPVKAKRVGILSFAPGYRTAADQSVLHCPKKRL